MCLIQEAIIYVGNAPTHLRAYKSVQIKGGVSFESIVRQRGSIFKSVGVMGKCL